MVVVVEKEEPAGLVAAAYGGQVEDGGFWAEWKKGNRRFWTWSKCKKRLEGFNSINRKSGPNEGKNYQLGEPRSDGRTNKHKLNLVLVSC